MQRHILFLFLLMIGCTGVKAQQKQPVLDYIAAYKELAMAEMKRTGVPAAITLAQGIHESSAGLSELTLSSNNHFGIKCKTGWTGPSVKHDDDARGECFRKYSTAEESFRDHSDFLKNSPRYAPLFKLNPGDYAAWARGLKAAGYATNPKYPEVLIKLIEDYNLQVYTLTALGIQGDNTGMQDIGKDGKFEVVEQRPDVQQISVSTEGQHEDAPVMETKMEEAPAAVNYPEGIFKINETKVIFARSGTPFLLLANQNNISLSNLFKFNDQAPAEQTLRDQLVYLQPKRKTGAHDFHMVEPGETLWDIAQLEAIRLESLQELNWLKDGQMPAVGEKLNLQKKSDSIPKLALKDHISVFQPGNTGSSHR